jgi:hypothetical protein
LTAVSVVVNLVVFSPPNTAFDVETLGMVDVEAVVVLSVTHLGLGWPFSDALFIFGTVVNLIIVGPVDLLALSGVIVVDEVDVEFVVGLEVFDVEVDEASAGVVVDVATSASLNLLDEEHVTL